MKFLCPGCKAKYQISDQKVAGKTLKMNCRQCGEEIVIRGDSPGALPRTGGGPPPPPPPAAAPSALGAGFRGQLTSRAPSPPAAAPDEWHVAINDIPVGPMRREEVGRKIAAGAVKPDSLAWREGLDDWLPVRNIPELAVLCQQAGQLSVPAPPAPMTQQPEQRSPQVAPVGARMAPMPPMEPPPPPPPPAFGVSSPGAYGAPVAPNPMDNTGISVVQGMPGAPSRQPNMAAMIFMALAAGAFLIMLGGLMFKMMSAPAEAPQAVAPPAAATAPPPELELMDEEPEAHVIDLDMEQIAGDAEDEEEVATASTKRAKSTVAKKSTGKQLTAEEKARLERMGGGFGTTPSSLGRTTGTGSRAGGGGSSGTGLSAGQLSKVVLKQRKNLQRCYETALRKAPSDDPVKLVVEIKVSPAGNVQKTTITGNGLMGMEVCIQRSVKTWRFPSAGASSTVKFPLLFQPGG